MTIGKFEHRPGCVAMSAWPFPCNCGAIADEATDRMCVNGAAVIQDWLSKGQLCSDLTLAAAVWRVMLRAKRESK